MNPTTPQVHIRKSMIEDMSFCPLKFKRVWLQHEQRDATYVMHVGSRFHEFAKRFFDFSDALPPEQWELLIPDEFVEAERTMAEWFVNYERSELARLTSEDHPDLWRPLFREYHMISDDLMLEGTIDRIDVVDPKEETFRVVEYKTGQSMNSVSNIRQLAFYSLLWEHTTKGKIVGMKVINPRRQEVFDYAMRPNYVDGALRDIAGLRNALKKDEFPPTCSERKFAMCRMCKPEETGIFVEG